MCFSVSTKSSRVTISSQIFLGLPSEPRVITLMHKGSPHFSFEPPFVGKLIQRSDTMQRTLNRDS